MLAPSTAAAVFLTRQRHAVDPSPSLVTLTRVGNTCSVSAAIYLTRPRGTVHTSVPFGTGAYPSLLITLPVPGALIDTRHHIAEVASKPGRARTRPVDTHPLSLRGVTVMLTGSDVTLVSRPPSIAHTR